MSESILVTGFLLALFTYMAWGLNALIRAVNDVLEWDPLDPAMSGNCEESDIATDSTEETL